MTPKAKAAKHKQEYIKNKHQQVNQQSKKQHMEGEKISANCTSGKRVISRIFKELPQINMKKQQLKNKQRT